MDVFNLSQTLEQQTPILDAGATDYVALRTIIYVFQNILPMFLIILGFVGNIFSYVLMNNKKYSYSTACYYMRCLAISDSCYLFARSLRFLMIFNREAFAEEITRRPYCGFYMGVLYFSWGLWWLWRWTDSLIIIIIIIGSCKALQLLSSWVF